jgi:septal ring factor EnvC (AmiA/AmiB activator)
MSNYRFSPRRRRWKHAGKLWLAVTILSLSVLFGLRLFSTHSVAAKAVASSAQGTPKTNPEIDALNRKITEETQEHQRLEAKRMQLAASSTQPAPLPAMSPEQRARAELTRKLVRLLALEKESPEGSPEIVDTRQQIDALQAQMAEMPQEQRRAYFRPRAATQIRPIELAETENKISLNEVSTKADARRLADLLRAQEITDARRAERDAYWVPTLLAISVLLGFLSAAGVLLWHFYRAVRDEAALRAILPRGVELVGAVPPMRPR